MCVIIAIDTVIISRINIIHANILALIVGQIYKLFNILQHDHFCVCIRVVLRENDFMCETQISKIKYCACTNSIR